MKVKSNCGGPSKRSRSKRGPRCVIGRLWLGMLALVAVPMLCAAERPNIVLILADDLGFSDLGCYGGEIETPNLDRLAASGLRLTQFYNCAKCETTRATLLSGRYQHEVGIGKLQHCATLAEVLKAAGYTTLAVGKWHMSGHPMDRGFDRYFGHLSGACNYFWGDRTFRLDREVFQVPRQGFYTTDADTDYAIEFIRQADRAKPFFLYLAYNAPHYPLQAPREDVLKYRGRYRIGWDEVRERRYRRQIELGLLPATQKPAPRPDNVPAWKTLSPEEQDEQDLVMATYAGMVDRLDRNIGRLIAFLRQQHLWENTLILFFSDNGACPFQRTRPDTRAKHLNPWDPTSYWTYDHRWAHACNTPFREYKRNQHEGGISSPFIAHWPQGIRVKPGTISSAPAHLVDIMATFLDLAGTSYPSAVQGQPTGPIRGYSLRPIFETGRRSRPDPLIGTFYGRHNFIRVGDWKLVNKDSGPWELYDLSRDRAESHNLAETESARFDELQHLWQEWSRKVGVPQPGDRKKPKPNAEQKGSAKRRRTDSPRK